MTRRSHLVLRTLWSLAVLLLSHAPVTRADMIPVSDGRKVYAKAVYQGVPQEGTFHADFFQWFDATANPEVTLWEPCEGSPEDSCTIGDAASFAYQLSLFLPNGMQFNGATSGRWGGPPSGSYEFESLFQMTFQLIEPHRYNFFWEIDPGEWPSIGLVRGYIRLTGPVPYLSFNHLEAGVLADSGMLGPGTYTLEARSWGASTEEFWGGAVYSGTFECVPDTTTQLFYEPQDQVVGVGGTITFSAGAPCTGATYQWRRNLTPLSNGGRVSGATGPTLTIQNATAADSGYYDVIVTCAGAPRISRLAHLGVLTTITGVGDERIGPAPMLTIRTPGPNPFRSATWLQYAAALPMRVRAEVFDARGARVRTLMDGIISGNGSFVWDGATPSGTPVPAGIYFLRVAGDGFQETRKLVLVR